MEVDEEEKICRYCFDGEAEGELISPCQCSGGQKYVHLKCLRQWQRMVLVMQPTHPAFYDRDLRHQSCGVCKAEFTCPPPTRLELMASFTGPEIAALIREKCIIAATEAFSAELKTQLERMSVFQRQHTGYLHWVNGVFLITDVEEDEGEQTLTITSQSSLQQLRRKLDASLGLTLQGRHYSLARSHSLAGLSPGRDLRSALESLETPCLLCFRSDEPSNCGNDHVAAVNLTRPLSTPPRPGKVDAALSSVCSKNGFRGATRVQLSHFIGGPCDEDDLVCCIVLGGGGCGWTVVKKLERALELAHTRAARRSEAQGSICGGQIVRLTGLQSAAHLNGELGIALRFEESNSRWLVRLRDGDGKQLRPQNLEGLEGAGGRVLCFWGDARWSRAQLLGEIAKGDWGLCHANIGDLAVPHTECWKNTDGRLAIAPITEMTEDYMRNAHQEMVATHAAVQMHNPEPAEEEEPPEQ
mmetsp:Transcript_75966/g.197650  ORF Transcript_75966/g.197650 Transcript_75966/m.197650 type:complete len:470 (+) Transcript_75966:64-1473(+)|eukprot:CAMPEP_0115571538 /NCGR_PEP_ID=MMETSP0271-20121206/106258_1 /TAXON_ID=71861 /ORGANISM="Scrippsiella trochoidea, Strain CCMP3099" /LENGTH=469 /DNA_ID=CAMNT_0003006093 /DNA_START=39 /DNA_END=1448 /DNA_ORIENTATION=-